MRGPNISKIDRARYVRATYERLYERAKQMREMTGPD